MWHKFMDYYYSSFVPGILMNCENDLEEQEEKSQPRNTQKKFKSQLEVQFEKACQTELSLVLCI